MMRRHARNLASKEVGNPAFIKLEEEFYSCSIVDLSLAGAGLRLYKAMKLPDKFELRFGRTSRNCSLIWQESENAGVLFEADNTGPSEQPKSQGMDA